MKFKLLILSLAVVAFAFKTTGDYSNLKIGAKAPMTDYAMKDVSGKDISLKAAKGEQGLLVIFSCNTCPFVVGNGSKSEGWENRYNEITKMANKQGINTILVNSNEAKRNNGDSYDDMVKRAKEQAFTSFYTLDEGHKLADAFGARTTPHVFLFNQDMKLAYQGAIDDNVDKKKSVKVSFLKDALSALAKKEDVPVKETKPVGCSIKRIQKTD